MSERVSPPDKRAPALLRGEPYIRFPENLYIPPDALEVLLETFEGPLDLLLYLIKRHDVDILDVPIAEITRQYLNYLSLMRELRLELAAEYLVMAAMLAEIKSRMLLPRPLPEEAEEEDPRAELVRRLQEYERFKRAAQELDDLPRVGRELHLVAAAACQRPGRPDAPAVHLTNLLDALQDVMRRAEYCGHHHISREPLSVRERMSRVLEAVQARRSLPFSDLLSSDEGRAGVVVTILAVLELIRESLLDLTQDQPFAPIYLRVVGSPAQEPLGLGNQSEICETRS